MAQNTTFFSSWQSSWNFDFAQAVSYQRKMIKNNVARIFALSIPVFGWFVIENCSFYFYFYVNAITSLQVSNFVTMTMLLEILWICIESQRSHLLIWAIIFCLVSPGTEQIGIQCRYLVSISYRHLHYASCFLVVKVSPLPYSPSFETQRECNFLKSCWYTKKGIWHSWAKSKEEV